MENSKRVRSRSTSVPIGMQADRDDLGCEASKLGQNLLIEGGDIRVYQKQMDRTEPVRVSTPASERGFLAGVSLGSGHRRRIFRGLDTDDRVFEPNSIYIRDLSEQYTADLCGGFHFVLFELSGRFLSRLADEHGSPVIHGLVCPSQCKDAALGNLARALTASAARDGALDKLFVEQLAFAAGIHIARHYGNLANRETRTKGGLAATQEARAKELLLLRAAQRKSLADIARECGLSHAYFIRAFARSTGCTPHQWLLGQRVEQARRLIEHSERSLTEIATDCEFSDQSHLNRVFVKVYGVPPGAWRKTVKREASAFL
ncbi:AraC-like DNA-binding protein [Paraburkholderia unamae]|uniref:helix-turn-helix domain-containing protein n=1 Tax=Paraburkholderia unamae TaxID=219649 RepID=UPI000DC48B4F|nr:AraC family transcriptional regulator [Paraburkholderia unamae]RAR59284.1 AraC-like DNA-binding protein [Paraburkholderia unamae]